MRRTARLAVLASLAATSVLLPTGSALASPVCTDGYKSGPPLAVCGNRIFPEAAVARSYVQLTPYPGTGFSEFVDGIGYMAEKYPRWVSVMPLSSAYGENAVSVGADGIRPGEDGDTGDGQDLWVIKITDHQVPDKGKDTLFFSLSVHGNERGGLEGGLRTAEDLAMAAENGGTIVDGVPNYESTTGKDPEFHEYEVADVLAKEAVYLMCLNPDGWKSGDITAGADMFVFGRENGAGTDLNRQMPTVGRIDINRNPLQEPEAKFGVAEMRRIAKAGRNGLLAYGADVHGELTSRAYVDIMYPAGQFDSVKHRQHMAIAERTTSVIDATLYAGIQNEIEEATGGNESEGIEDVNENIPDNTIPTKPSHWGTVWDTLGYTDTGFIGDYLATDLGTTGMDYEIMLNHTVPEKTWNSYLQENHINASRAIIKTAMAYALTQTQEFNDKNVVVDSGGQAGYITNPDRVTNKDKNGPGTLPGSGDNGTDEDGKKIPQANYNVSNQDWFTQTNRLMPRPFLGLAAADVANNPKTLDALDTLVLADIALPRDTKGRAVNAAKYWANVKSWVQRGGNLVLTDRAIHALTKVGVVAEGETEDITVYQPYADITDFEEPLVAGLRANARQLVEAPALGYEIGESASPMTAVDSAAWEAAGGTTIGTTTAGKTTIGTMSVGAGIIKIVGGALPMPTEENDHRFGLRSYAMTYSGLYIMENAIQHDVPNLGKAARPGFTPGRPTPKPAPRPVATRPEPLPATGAGWEMVLAGTLVLAFAARARRRRQAA